MTGNTQQFPYRASPITMIGCIIVFSIFGLIGAYAASTNDRGLIIDGVITLNQTQAIIFWWCLTGICGLFVLLAFILAIGSALRQAVVVLSDDSVQIPKSLFRRGVTTIRFDDVLGISETVIHRQRMLNIQHRNGRYTIPASMLSAEAYETIRQTLVDVSNARGGTGIE